MVQGGNSGTGRSRGDLERFREGSGQGYMDIGQIPVQVQETSRYRYRRGPGTGTVDVLVQVRGSGTGTGEVPI